MKQTRWFHLKASFTGCWGSSFHTWWVFTDLNTHMEDKWNLCFYVTLLSVLDSKWDQNQIQQNQKHLFHSTNPGATLPTSLFCQIFRCIMFVACVDLSDFTQLPLARFFLAQNESLDGGQRTTVSMIDPPTGRAG